MVRQNFKMFLAIKSSFFVLAVASLTIFNTIAVIPRFQETLAQAQSQGTIGAKRKLLTSASVDNKFKTFVEKRTYSIAYPQGWFIQREHRDLAIITNRRLPKTGDHTFPNYLIKTDVQITEENFQSVLTRSSSDTEDGERLIKRGNVRIDGKNAVRLWFKNDDIEMLLTLIPYTRSKTAYLITFYSKNNSHLLPLIERMHSSFKSLQ